MSGVHPVPATSSPKPGPIPAALSFLFGLFTRNLPAKLAAIVLALIVWFTVRQDLTANYIAEHCQVKLDGEAGLVFVDSPPEHLSIEFEGPRSVIDAVKKDTAVSFVVRKDDLVGQAEARLTFSVERGNIRHDYGDEIDIVSVDGAPFELRVAVLERKRVRVLAPEVIGEGDDWDPKAEVLDPEIVLIGPRSSLDQIQDLQPEPVDVSRFFEGVAQAEALADRTVELTLPPRLKKLRVMVEGGAPPKCRVEFPLKSGESALTVPIVVYHPGDAPMTVTLQEFGQVRKTNGAFEIELRFVGAPSRLAVLEQDIAAKKVRAYVRSEDSDLYRDEEEGTGYFIQTDLRVEGLTDGVRHKPPAEQISYEVKAR